MASLEDLLDALMRWSIQLTENDIPQPWDAGSLLIALAEVLCQVDHEYFYPLTTGADAPSPTAIVAVVSAFYRQELGMQLFVQPPGKEPSEECLLELFRLVFGLALHLKKEKCLTKVMQLQFTDQEVLMSFVNDLVQRGSNCQQLPPLNLPETEFKEPTPSVGGRTSRQTYRLLDQLELRESECRHYKDKLEQLQQRYKELEYHKSLLQQQNHKLHEQLILNRNDRLQLVIELGIRSNQVGYGELVQRHREIINSYQVKIQDLEIQLDRKNALIEQRNSELQVLRKSFYGSTNTLPSESTISSEQYEKMQIQFQYKLEQLSHRIRDLTEQLAEKDSFNNKLTQQKQRTQLQNTQLRIAAAKTEQSMQRYRQLKKLTKALFKDVESHFRL